MIKKLLQKFEDKIQQHLLSALYDASIKNEREILKLFSDSDGIESTVVVLPDLQPYHIVLTTSPIATQRDSTPPQSH